MLGEVSHIHLKQQQETQNCPAQFTPMDLS